MEMIKLPDNLSNGFDNNITVKNGGDRDGQEYYFTMNGTKVSLSLPDLTSVAVSCALPDPSFNEICTTVDCCSYKNTVLPMSKDLVDYMKVSPYSLTDVLIEEANNSLKKKIEEYAFGGKMEEKRAESTMSDLGLGAKRVITNAFTIKDIHFSADKVIVLWKDNTKTIVTMQEDEDKYDPEKAILAAFTKKILRNLNVPAKDRSMNRIFDNYLTKYYEMEDEIKEHAEKVKERKAKKKKEEK